jgi:hypothetical protein
MTAATRRAFSRTARASASPPTAVAAATLVPHDDYKPCSEMLHGVLDASQGMGTGKVPRRAHYEQVPEVLVKQDFGGGARVGTTDDNRDGMLAVRDLPAQFRHRPDLCGRAGDMTRIPGLESRERAVGMNDADGIRGVRPCGGAQDQE